MTQRGGDYSRALMGMQATKQISLEFVPLVKN
jgi:hypothetical protein